MYNARTFKRITDFCTRVIMKHPAHLLIVAKIKNAFDDITRVLLEVNCFWVHVPKENGTQPQGFYRRFHGLAHNHIIPHPLEKCTRFGYASGMKILGIIPARGGSKSVPRKNIRDLGGKPLLVWTVEAARASGVLDRLILSTDDEEIAMVGKRWGVEVPFLRPAELAQDTTPTLPVLQHALAWLGDREAYEPDAVMLLQPTAPLRQPFHIQEAAALFEKTGADSVVSVVEIPGHFSPYWAVVEGGDGRARLWTGDPIAARIPRRQDFPRVTYAHNGAIYLVQTRLIRDGISPSMYGEHVRIYKMDPRYSVNIDSPDDWEDAEWAVRKFF